MQIEHRLYVPRFVRPAILPLELSHHRELTGRLEIQRPNVGLYELVSQLFPAAQHIFVRVCHVIDHEHELGGELPCVVREERPEECVLLELGRRIDLSFDSAPAKLSSQRVDANARPYRAIHREHALPIERAKPKHVRNSVQDAVARALVA